MMDHRLHLWELGHDSGAMTFNGRRSLQCGFDLILRVAERLERNDAIKSFKYAEGYCPGMRQISLDADVRSDGEIESLQGSERDDRTDQRRSPPLFSPR